MTSLKCYPKQTVKMSGQSGKCGVARKVGYRVDEKLSCLILEIIDACEFNWKTEWLQVDNNHP